MYKITGGGVRASAAGSTMYWQYFLCLLVNLSFRDLRITKHDNFWAEVLTLCLCCHVFLLLHLFTRFDLYDYSLLYYFFSSYNAHKIKMKFTTALVPSRVIFASRMLELDDVVR